MKAKIFPFYCLYTWLIIFSFVPIVLIFATSFLSKDATHLVTFPWTINNYSGLFTSSFLKIFYRSFWIALVTTAICFLLAYPLTYILIKAKKQSLMLLLIIIPFWTSALVRTYSLMAILKAKGIINFVLLKLHIISVPYPFLYTNFAVIFGLVYNLFPFMLLPLFSNMERFDFRLMEAAKDLGASTWDRFFRVFFPNTLNGVISGCLLVFLPAMTLFYIPNVLGGARSILIGNLIQDQFLIAENWPQGAATCMVLIAFLILFLMIFRRHNQLELH